MPPIKKKPLKWAVTIYAVSTDEASENEIEKFLVELNIIGRLLDLQGKSDEVKMFLVILRNWGSNESKLYYTDSFEIRPNFLDDQGFIGLDTDMGDYETLWKSMLDLNEDILVEKYMILLWGHGTGPTLFSRRLDEDTQKITEPNDIMSIIKRMDKEKTDDKISDSDIFVGGSNKVKEFFFNLSKHRELQKVIPNTARLSALTATEISKAFKTWSKYKGKKRKIDLLVVMGCANQMIEFGYEIRKHCKFLVASEELIYFRGYNYTRTFSRLLKCPDISELELGKYFVEDAERLYKKLKLNDCAISCVDLAYSNEIAKLLDHISECLITNFSSVAESIKKSRLTCLHLGQFTYDSYIDITFFLKNLLSHLGDDKISIKIKSAIDLLENKYIIQKHIGPDERKVSENGKSIGAHGVSIYFPDSEDDHYKNNQRGIPFTPGKGHELSFLKKNWNEMVRMVWSYNNLNPQIEDPRL